MPVTMPARGVPKNGLSPFRRTVTATDTLDYQGRTRMVRSSLCRLKAPAGPFGRWTARFALATACLGGTLSSDSLPSARAQAPLGPAAPSTGSSVPGQDPVYFRVDSPQQKLEMIVNSSRILTVDFNIPRYLVNNRDVATITPLAANQIQVSARRPGVTQINLWNESGEVSTVDVVVFADARELQNILGTVFPEAQLRVLPTAGSTQGSVIVTGYVADRESIPRILEVARDFYPNVINNIDVGGTQQVALKVKVLEVSRTKLRQAGVDWELLFGDTTLVATTIASVGGANTSVGIINGSTEINGILQLLQRNNLAKLMAEPTLTTVSGRAASFNSGGEIPIPTSAGLGSTTVEYRPFGTGLDFVPIVLGNGKIRLEVRPVVREVDRSLTDPVTGVPGFRTRQVDTAVELQPGQTLALAGLLQTRTSSSRQGIPWLSDIPWVGAAFRTVQEENNEVELLVLVTPELVAPLEAHEVPPCGPGQFTTSPDDVDLYWRGYIEVPRTDNFSAQIPPSACGPGGCPGGPNVAYGYAPGDMQGQPMSHGAAMQGQPMPAGMPVPPVVESEPVGAGSNPNAAHRTQARQRTTHAQSPSAPPLSAPRTANSAPQPPALIGPVGYDALR
jgi:pilus assembly protein CpaC